jgi:hypothetical protein
MNVKFKSALAVAALALGASAAQASIPADNIVLSIWNQPSQNAGYSFDTGISASSFNPALSGQSFTLTGAAVAAFNGGNATWNLFATDSSTGNFLTSTILNDAAHIGTGSISQDTDVAVSNAVGQASAYYGGLTSGTASAPPALLWANSMSQGGGQIGDQTDKSGAGSTYFETLSSADGSATLFSGTWTLSFNGAAGQATSATLTWNPTSTSVPLPAAVWLLGSGLMGLAGVGRRRKDSAA